MKIVIAVPTTPDRKPMVFLAPNELRISAVSTLLPQYALGKYALHEVDGDDLPTVGDENGILNAIRAATKDGVGQVMMPKTEVCPRCHAKTTDFERHKVLCYLDEAMR